MKILVLNCGSSSLKYSLIELPEYRVITVGLAERVGTAESFIKYQRPDGVKVERPTPIPDHTRGVEVILEVLLDPEIGHISRLEEIQAVGHRLVHGGEVFSGSVRIDDEVIAQLEKCIPLAPLHNPANIMGIRAAQSVLPGVPHCGVFDTAFHQTMPRHAYMYGLPYELYERHGVRRYGFHGTSHDYVSHRAAELVGMDYNQARIISAHVGSGASITAILNGQSVDTSMGMTPSEGLVMGTRAGDIDSGVVEFLLSKRDWEPSEIAEYIQDKAARGTRTYLTVEDLSFLLNKRSGIYGIGGIGSSDMRDIDRTAEAGNERTALAADVLEYRVKKYVGAYAAALGGLDILVFTAGVGENRPRLRSQVCAGLEFMGIKIDEAVNAATRGVPAVISTPDSRVKVVVIPTDEEYMIARETYNLLK